MSTNKRPQDGVPSTGGDDRSIPILFRTKVRKIITPYLPPPIISAMRQIDPQLEPLVGPEASITILGSFVLSFLLFWMVSKLLGTTTGGKAFQDDDHDQNVLQQHNEKSFDGTILLCGPSLGGKTTLFYQLLRSSTGTENLSGHHICTVKSIKSNTGFLQIPQATTDDSNANTTIWRIVDTPGHWGPEKLLQAITLSQVQRIVLVVDSTQPAALAADYLQALWTNSSTLGSAAPQLLVACHKSQHPKAKNIRRLKLQLRSELERLQKLQAMDDNAIVSSSIDWEQALNEQVSICSSDMAQWKDVQQFCQTGTIISNS
ncbi:signal recognition particle receptor beta subunit [Nitzschia inconspicua]|uniref:Signal recognition particle receptor beta subunit n=1 Tax=Nitzschia inconspicua TaxID=303405 RepID=A0A9K3KKN7_9STRA|nr:signal recognition particle receptor beta subunit [Nitzschia inconspicua]